MTDNLVDFHCHLDLYPDFPERVESCEQAGIYTLAVTTTPRAWQRNYDLTKNTRFVRAALGLHPQLVSTHAHELQLWEALLPKSRYVGEVGLDAGPKYYKSLSLQKDVFKRILKCCAAAGGKIITVHSVRSARGVLDLLDECLKGSDCKVVLHWFTGSASEARRAVEMGCLFSLNLEMIGNPRHQKWIAELPLDRVLTETDGPFTKIAGRASIPQDVQLALEALARLKAIDVGSLTNQVYRNLKAILQTPQ